jgi:hypothetical protein
MGLLESMAAPSGSRSTSTGGAWRSGVALVGLLRRSLGRPALVRVARLLGWTYAIIAVLLDLVVSRLLESNELALSARGAALIAIEAGGLAAFALARPPAGDAELDGIEAMAETTGLSPHLRQLATVSSCLILVGEAVVVPIVTMELLRTFVAPTPAVTSAGELPLSGSGAHPIVFALFAVTILGGLAGICRVYGGARGRLWFGGAILVPWILALAGAHADSAFSVPTLLEGAWQTLVNPNP